MKRTLHGKRHIRARKSVRAGREKRKMRKFNRLLKMLKRIASTFMIDVVNAVRVLVDAFVDMGNEIGEFMDKAEKIKIEQQEKTDELSKT
jgi:hypothetical protein